MNLLMLKEITISDLRFVAAFAFTLVSAYIFYRCGTKRSPPKPPPPPPPEPPHLANHWVEMKPSAKVAKVFDLNSYRNK
jgi:hypothetical protein